MARDYRILLIDENDTDRAAIREALHPLGDGLAVEECHDGETGLLALREGRFDCVLAGYPLPDMKGMALLNAVQEKRITTPIIILAANGNELLVAEAFKAGAADYLPKAYVNGPRLAKIVEEAVARRGCEARCGAGDAARERLSRLTKREREVLAMVLEGRSSKHIGHELGISCRTVEAHRSRIMQKTGCRTFAELIRTAVAVRGC